MIASIADVGPLCPGSQVGSIDLSSTPSDVNVVYSWTGGAMAGLADGTSTGVNPQIPSFTASTTEGTTVVTVTATLAGDCVSETTFLIDISDNEAPVFVNCPTNGFTVGVDPSCTGNVIWSIPVAQDNCGGVTVTETSAGGPYNGTPLAVGTYDIEYTATDGSGNTSTCTFTVEVIDNGDPLLVCPEDVTISSDDGVCTWASGAGELDPLLAVDNCPDFELSYEITGVTMSSGIGSVSAATQFELGESTITYTLTDDSGNEVMCSFTVTVVDTESPVISCPVDEVVANDAGQCSADIAALTQPGFSDNCSAVADSVFYSVTNPDNSISGPFGGAMGYVFSVGVSQVEWTVVDSSGNSASCIQNITVEDTEEPTITCATLAAAYNTDAGACDYTVQGVEFDPVVGDNCAVESVSNDYNATSSLANAVFPVGSTPVVWTVTDESGNTATCAITVVVEDNETPVFVNCPADTITVGNDFSNCQGGVNWSVPIADDNCEVSVAQTAGPTAGDILDVGNYTVTYIATDDAGNTAECTFEIEVLDVQEPIIGCPQDVTISTDAGVCEWASQTGSLTPSVAIENCGADLQWSVENPDGSVASDSGDVSGYVFLLGESTVTYTLSDSTGTQVDECSFRVTVEDTEAPVILDCSAGALFGAGNQVFVNDDGLCSTELLGSFGSTDNCGLAAEAYIVFTRPDGSLYEDTMSLAVGVYELALNTYEVGQWTYEITVYDESGNSSTCTGQFEVLDTEDPTIECAILAAAYDTDAGACDYTVQGTEFDPVVGDNCAVESVSNDYNATSSLANEVFPVGSTDVVWTVTDESGNTATCAITVVVEDNENPVFVNCPADTITVGNDFSNCQGGVNWSVPIADDNCEVSVAQTAGP